MQASSSSIQQLLQKATQALKPIIDTPTLDAELLLAYACKKDRSYLHAWPEKKVPEKVANFFCECLERRMLREPLAYIIGIQEFWSLSFCVNSNVLVPRPETELLVENVLSRFPANQAIKIADLGTGSGAIAIALASERPKWEIYATDICCKALQLARYNADRLELKNIYFSQGNWCEALPLESFDVIVSNPPYIAAEEWLSYEQDLHFEPKQALLAEKQGLSAFLAITLAAKSYLKPKGLLMFEHGFAQGEQVRNILENAGFIPENTLLDLNGQPRLTLGLQANT